MTHNNLKFILIFSAITLMFACGQKQVTPVSANRDIDSVSVYRNLPLQDKKVDNRPEITTKSNRPMFCIHKIHLRSGKTLIVCKIFSKYFFFRMNILTILGMIGLVIGLTMIFMDYKRQKLTKEEKSDYLKSMLAFAFRFGIAIYCIYASVDYLLYIIWGTDISHILNGIKLFN